MRVSQIRETILWTPVAEGLPDDDTAVLVYAPIVIGQSLGALLFWWLYTNGHVLLAGIYLGVAILQALQTLIELAQPSTDSRTRG